MIINKIKLENIRSYVNEEIALPKGRLLLSGDIGSGKSTVLYAIDFALFGLRQKEMSGSSLLRNGTNKGSVELHFSVDNKNIVIKRLLRRDASVLQDNGYIIINNEKINATPVELKQRILDIINYPKELLTKSKSLIYRYTVYTPQEEMKQILIGSKEIRLDTLRRVFGIDKYKQIKENIKPVASWMREKMREMHGNISDLDDKIEEMKEYKNKRTA